MSKAKLIKKTEQKAETAQPVARPTSAAATVAGWVVQHQTKKPSAADTRAKWHGLFKTEESK